MCYRTGKYTVFEVRQCIVQPGNVTAGAMKGLRQASRWSSESAKGCSIGRTVSDCMKPRVTGSIINNYTYTARHIVALLPRCHVVG